MHLQYLISQIIMLSYLIENEHPLDVKLAALCDNELCYVVNLLASYTTHLQSLGIHSGTARGG